MSEAEIKPSAAERKPGPERIIPSIKAKENSGSSEKPENDQADQHPKPAAETLLPVPEKAKFSEVVSPAKDPELIRISKNYTEADNSRPMDHPDETSRDELSADIFKDDQMLGTVPSGDRGILDEDLREGQDELYGVEDLAVFDEQTVAGANAEHIQDNPARQPEMEDWLELGDTTASFAEHTELALEAAEPEVAEKAEDLIERIENFILRLEPDEMDTADLAAAETNEAEQDIQEKLTALITELAETLELDYSEAEITKITAGLLELKRQLQAQPQLPVLLPLEKGTREFKLTQISNLFRQIKKPLAWTQSFLGFIVLKSRFNLRLTPDSLAELN